MTTIFKPYGSNFHAHADSSLDGASSVKKIVKRAKELQYQHVVLTEHGNLNSAADLGMCASDAGISYSHGIEAYLDTPFEELGIKPDGDGNNHKRQYSHVTILFKTRKAYQYFCRLTPVMESRAVTRWGERKPILKWDELVEIGSEIILGSGCLNSLIGRFVRVGDYATAERAYQMCRSVVSQGSFFLEIFPHAITHDWKKPIYDANNVLVSSGQFMANECICGHDHNDIQRVCNEFLISMAEKYNDPMILSEDSHFAYESQRVIQESKLGNGSENWRMYNSYHMYSQQEHFQMLNKSINLSERQMEQMIDNSYLLKDQLSSYKFLTNKDRWVLPVYHGDTKKHLIQLIQKHGRMVNSTEYIKRLKYEMSVLADNGYIDFLPYFFEVEDVSSWCKANDILMNLRGSGGGVLIAYLLGFSITDPIKYELPFERFITVDRIKANVPPDLDSDFSDKTVVMDNRKKKYGDRIASLSINLNLKLKNSIKDAERAILGKVRPETEVMCHSFPGIPQGPTEEQWLLGYDDKETGDHVDGFWEQSEELRQYASSNPDVWKMVVECLGVMRNKGGHACGHLITPTPVQDQFPLTWVGTKGTGHLYVGFGPAALEWAGGIKYDFLGVKTLKTIEIATKLIKERHGITLEWREYDHSDAVYEKIFHTGDTLGVFQFGTPAVIPYLKKTKPKNTRDLCAITSLVRPGTLSSPAPDGSDRTCAEYYVAVAQGEKPYYIHPDLEPILRDTNGVNLYQEQTLKIFVYSGLLLSEAEAVRRAISKKKKEVLQKLIGELKERLLNKGWTQYQTDLLGDQIIASNKYAFNAAHGQSYGIVGYNTAWLKYYYPLEFFTAELTVFSDKEEKLKQYVALLRDRILQPSISKSHPTDWQIEGECIRAPLSMIKGLGESGTKVICENAPYVSVADFAKRCSGKAINRATFTKLVFAGLFDEFSIPYGDMIKEYWVTKKIKDPISDECKITDKVTLFAKRCELNMLTRERLCDIVSDRLLKVKFISVKNIGVPFVSPQSCGLLADVSVAAKALESPSFAERDIFMVALFKGSSVDTTKTGKKLLKVKLSDGTTDFEAVNWRQFTALRFPKDSVVLIKGKIRKGWKVPVSINFSSIEQLKSEEI